MKVKMLKFHHRQHTFLLALHNISDAGLEAVVELESVVDVVELEYVVDVAVVDVVFPFAVESVVDSAADDVGYFVAAKAEFSVVHAALDTDVMV